MTQSRSFGAGAVGMVMRPGTELSADNTKTFDGARHMKKIAALTSLFALTVPAAWGASVDLTITNIKSDSGEIVIGVFASEEGWKSDNQIADARVDAETGEVTLTIDDLPEGEIAFKLYHDVDGDGDLKRGSFGRPVEPYGFSNDAPVRFGPPSWTAAKFQITSETTAHTLALR